MTNIQILDPAPSYEIFRKTNLEGNTPCLISPDLILNWPALSVWRGPSGPDWTYFREQYGNEVVSVAHCSSRAFSDQKRSERPLHEIIDLWEVGQGDGLYVKDWHLARSMRERGDAPCYETPDIFLDDWMNSYWEQEGKDDFRFVYVGVAGTFTPLHQDVYTSYSWSTNITGIKIWRLFPPSVSHLLRRYPERASSEIVYDVRDVDCKVFGRFEDACQEMIVVEQRPGWTIFVGWYHQVENVTDAISINHNWCNITNLPSMYAALLVAVGEVELALADVQNLLRTRSGNSEWEKEWTEVVQDVLRKDSGWDWMTFWRMILHNIGQMLDPPLIPDPVWPTPPPTLRPSLPDTKPTILRVIHHFSSTRAADTKHIADMCQTLNTLRVMLSSP